MHQIPKLECFVSRLAVVFVQSIGARCSSWEWRRSWSSTDRRCSSYVWVMNNLIAYWGAPYIRELTALELFGGVGVGGGGWWRSTCSLKLDNTFLPKNSLLACVCVYVCNHNLSPVQARITKCGPEVQNTLVKITTLLFKRLNNLDFQGQM